MSLHLPRPSDPFETLLDLTAAAAGRRPLPRDGARPSALQWFRKAVLAPLLAASPAPDAMLVSDFERAEALRRHYSRYY